MIRSFRDAEAEKVFLGIPSRKFQAVEKTAIRKLFQLHAARTLHDLRAPGNSLEALKGDRAGQHSVGSTTDTASASSGSRETRIRSRSPIITDQEDRHD